MRVPFAAQGLRPVLALSILLALSPRAEGGSARFVQYPDIHGETIVFTWEGDLFSACLLYTSDAADE